MKLTFSTQLLTLNYLLYSTTDAAPQFLKKLTPFTKSWFQILITLKSMRCRGASLQLIMAGSKSYIPTGIFAKARFHIFNRNSISIVISGDGISIKNFINPTIFKKKGSERCNLPKDGEFKTQPVEKNFEVNKYSKINQFQPPPSCKSCLSIKVRSYIQLYVRLLGTYIETKSRSYHLESLITTPS